MTIQIHGPTIDPAFSADCEPILRALTDWFEIESALVDYARAAGVYPTLLARAEDGRAVGFLTILQHNPYSAEIYVMGVLPEYHRQGVGRALVEHAERALCKMGVEYLQVKTLAASHPDPGYAKTRKFYEGLGFRPLEVLPSLWNEANPCLVMVKGIKN